MKRYTNVPGLAERYVVKEPTVRAWVRYLDIPVIRAGRLVRFDVAATDLWFESGGPNGLAASMKADAVRRSARDS